MTNLVKDTQTLYDAKGKKTHVLMPIKKYEELMERLEDAEDIRAMEEVAHEKSIPWSEVKKEIRKKRR